MPPETPAPDRLPPQNREAERSVLGSMLRDNAVIGDIVLIIRTEQFYSDAHQKIFAAITTLYDTGKPVDTIVLAEILHQRGQIEDIGGYAYLDELWDAAPTAANATYYANIVRERSLVRGLIHTSTEILRDAYDQVQPADEMVQTAEKKIFEIASSGIVGQVYDLREAVDDAFERIDQQALGNVPMSGVPTGYMDLDEITAGLHNNELVIIAARPSVGKCLTADAEIVLADGSVATIEEIYRRRQARLLTLHNDYRLRLTEPSAFVDDGVKQVYRLTTRLGRQVEATAIHPFLTLGGWRPLAKLRPGDRIAVPRRLDVFGTETLRECEVKLLAYLIGDGCLTDTTPEFTNGNPRLRDDFTATASEFGPVKVREESHGGRTPTLHVSGDPDFLDTHRQRFAARLRSVIDVRSRSGRSVAEAVGVTPSSVCHWSQGATVPNRPTFDRLCTVLAVEPDELAPHGHAAIRHNGMNPLTLWLKVLDLWGKGAHDKHVPRVIFRLKRSLVALFLNRLFATDGWATVLTAGNPQLGYCSVSERLIRQVQHLLLRFGIIAALRRRSVKYKDGRRTAWQLDITDQASIRLFIEEIGIFGKEAALAKVVAALEGRNHQTNCDLIPVAIWERLAEAKGDESWCSLGRRAGFGGHTNLHVGTRAPSRRRLARFADALDDDSLRDLATSDIYWDAIVSITDVGHKQVYDLTIPDTHNFVANDVCVHNTAFALNVIRNIVVEEKQPAFFVSLEQARIELAERLLVCQARVDSHKLRKGRLNSDDIDKLMEAGGILKNAKLFIDDTPAQSMLRIAANARRLKMRQGIKVVVIDYLQLIEPDNRRDPRQEQVAQISRRLKFLARELQIPVVALAQVNRSSEDRQDHRPRLADLRESGSIEQDADTVILLHRPDRYEPGQHEGIIEVIVGKQRNGPTGEVTLTYIKQYMRFENHAIGTPFEG